MKKGSSMSIIKRIPTPYAVSALAFSSDKKCVAAANGLLPEVLIFDVETGNQLITIENGIGIWI